jgi:hypothetical protein
MPLFLKTFFLPYFWKFSAYLISDADEHFWKTVWFLFRHPCPAPPLHSRKGSKTFCFDRKSIRFLFIAIVIAALVLIIFYDFDLFKNYPTPPPPQLLWYCFLVNSAPSLPANTDPAYCCLKPALGPTRFSLREIKMDFVFHMLTH